MTAAGDEKQGSVKISDEVIAVCAMNATMKTNGVFELAGGLTDTLTRNILGKDSSSKGIKINQSEEGVTVDVYINVDYGAKIPQVAWDIQENVKNEIEHMTDLPVNAVNIHVMGVHFNEEQE